MWAARPISVDERAPRRLNQVRRPVILALSESQTMPAFRPDRRRLLLGVAALGLVGPQGAHATSGTEQAYAGSPWRKLSDANWKQRLPPASFDVLRRDGTERPFSSPLLNEHRKGVFACLGCGLPLFRSDWKFESGTGWPSFYEVIEPHVGRKSDYLLITPRTEYHCAQCLGHQGHVFKDGPKPTGLRYCNDGVALRFVAA
jgi:peptide-methionine (R)-S-oxide reductase